ncbi:MAG: MOSC N-terminal beta barrel domain-containing protein [Leptospiraceae bacterium]|nr:MOSC N-terminal beta barrel domain-containing protein [Leptospiraceae bacterium]
MDFQPALLSRIQIFPVKSLQGLSLAECQIGHHSLLHDRRFAMFTANGQYMIGKRNGRVNQLEARFNLEKDLITLRPREDGGIEQGASGRRIQTIESEDARLQFSAGLRDAPADIGPDPGRGEETFHFKDDRASLERYLSIFFGESITLREDTAGGQMDLPLMRSATLVSSASLESLAPDLGVTAPDDLRQRFRFNLEVEGWTAFAEESLIGQSRGTRIQVGDVEMVAVVPCKRCSVPSRDLETGRIDPNFVKSMVESRKLSLPPDSPIPEFGSLYYLTIGLFIPASETGKSIRCGDPIRAGESVRLRFSPGGEVIGYDRW